jgi:EpsI family protein
LKSRAARLVTILLLVQAAVLYSSIRPEAIPLSHPLAEVPRSLGGWQLQSEGVIDPETQAVLQADDVLDRFYAAPSGEKANLFIAAFRSQRNGKAPHSPKNCLPGNGWTPLVESEYSIDVGRPEPIVVNQYIVTHGEDRSLVFYWYQSRDRVVASEYKAKFWVIADAIRYNRTDTAIVRVTVAIINRDNDRAIQTAVAFVKTFFAPIRQILPS